MSVTHLHALVCAGGGSKDARDMRDMEMERRLRAGEQISEPWTQLGGFEKYTKVNTASSIAIRML